MNPFISKKDIEAAYSRIKPHINLTPLKHSAFFSEQTGQNVFMKLENLNITGSFKIRGAANCLLQQPEESVVVAASAGNHAQGVAKICQMRGFKTDIFMPLNTPLKKVNATKKYGANVHLVGDTFDEAFCEAENFSKENSAFLIHAFANEDVMTGQGTVALELFQQLDSIDYIFVPIGGGGLISGIASYAKEHAPNCKIIGVQTSYYPGVFNSFLKKTSAPQKYKPTIADGIAVKQHLEMSDRYFKKFVDDIILVDENEIALSIFNLLENEGILAEGAGAASLCGVKKYFANKENSSKNIVGVISGGNVDITLVDKIINRGLIEHGRYIRLSISIDDRPNSLAKLLQEIGTLGGNILEINHNRSFSTSEYHMVDCSFDIETVGLQHSKKLVSKLKSKGYNIFEESELKKQPTE